MIKAILALDENNGIGYKNALPWPNIPEDMAWFKKSTKDSVVIMGSKTFGSLGYKNLPNRYNIVITSDPKSTSEAHISLSPPDIPAYLRLMDDMCAPDIWVIGGKSIYEQTFKYCDEIYVTRIHGSYECDTHIEIDKHLEDFYLLDTKQGAECNFEIWCKK